jgi:hypothetical protein
MKFFLILVWYAFFICAGHGGWAAVEDGKKAEIADDKDFLQDLENIKDPFVSPLAKKVEETPIKIQKPPEPVKPPVPEPSRVEPRPIVPPSMPVLPQVPLDDKANIFTTGAIKISGIIWNTDLPQAIVNDRVVRVGEDLQGAKILSIKKEGIEVMYRSTKYTLRISDEKDKAVNSNRNPSLDTRRN